MKIFNIITVMVLMLSACVFAADPNEIYEDFEYASVSELEDAGWSLTFGEAEFVDTLSISNQTSLKLGQESNSALVKEFETGNKTGVFLSVWVNADAPADPDKCASRLQFTILDDNDNYATIRMGAAGRGYRTLDVRCAHTGSSWVFPSPGIHPTGWNKLSFAIDDNALVSMYFNDTLLATTDQLAGLSSVKLWTPLEFEGNRSGGVHVDAFVYTQDDFDQSSCGGSDNLYKKEDFDNDCDVDIDDLTAFVSAWLFKADYTWTEYAYLTGTIQGIDGDELQSMIGIDILDEEGNKRTYAGGFDEVTAYQGNIIWMNRYDDVSSLNGTIAFNGKDWVLGPIAIPEGETWTLWVEAYPKLYTYAGSTQTTDLSKYSRTHWHGIKLTHGATKHIDVEMPLSSEAASLSGRVTDNGQPVADTYVHLWGWGVVNGPYDSVLTDANGYFTHTHTSGWGKNPSDPTQIISPVDVALMVNGEVRVLVRGVGPNDSVANVNIELTDAGSYEINN